MTFQRLLNRNGLQEGDYTSGLRELAAASEPTHVDLDAERCGFVDVEALERAYRGLWDSYRVRHVYVSERLRLLVGDLRRLERDAVDERGICTHIVQRTGLAPDVVAAVLKEFVTL